MRGKVRICGLEDPAILENPPTLRFEIHGVDNPDYLDQLNVELQTLILTRKGTLPGSRDYGMDLNYIDYVTPEAINMYAIALDEAVAKWIPDIALTRVRTVETSEHGARCVLVATFDFTGETEVTAE